MYSFNSSSPPFQISDTPLKELTNKDFAKIFPNKDKLTIEPIKGGLSGAKIYKVIANTDHTKKEYLVRHSSGIFGAKEIFHELAIQKEMGAIGISPKVYYSNPNQGIVAMEYINNQLSTGRDPNILNNIPNSLENLVKVLQGVHQHQKLNNKITNRIALDYIKRSYQELPRSFLDKDDAALLKLAVNTPWPTGKATLTHNDFRSDNLLYDGHHFLLIDWELGGLGHPFYDLAYFANYQALSLKEGDELFSLYLTRKPSIEEFKNYHRMRRIAFCFSATLALPGLAKLGDEVKQPREGEPSFNNLKELWQRIDEKKLDFDTPRDEYRISLFLLRASADY